MVYKIPPGGGEVNHIQPVAYFVLVANTTTGPDSKLHLTLHLIAIPCSKVAYLE